MIILRFSLPSKIIIHELYIQVISTTKENKPDYLCLGDEVDKMDDSYCYRYAPYYLRQSNNNP